MTGWLFERMHAWAGEPALVFRDVPCTYAALLARAEAWDAELSARGVAAGNVVLLEGGFSPGAVSLLLALVRRGAIAVPLTALLRVHRAEFSDIAEVQHAFTFDEADAWTYAASPREVTHALTRKLVARGHPGLVIFSSGSTGRPKAVLHDFAGLLEKFRPAGARKRSLTFLLFDHIGGMDTLFNTLANGGTLVVPTSREPDVVCAAIARHGVHTLPTSPTFLNLLLVSEAWRRHDLSSLQVVAYGTEPMPEALLGRLREALPHVKWVQTYGTSELGVLRARGREGAPQWIRFRSEGFETRVVDGVLWVRSPAAMLGYLNAPDLFDEEGWLNTQDAVQVEGEYLRVLGRVSDLINVGGQKVYPAEVEGVLLALDNVRDVAVYGERHPLTGHIVAARVSLVTPEPLDAFKRRLRLFCRERLPSYKVPARIELTEQEQFGARMKKLRPAAGSAEPTP
ncbi:AMP-binding protein [Aggregicoccus sp. 17bor-14]|uniref:class I adenylate-forming enzyme family protein n=1 Tax=Myxococcaceae TaxID=31 RepID=UPI00129C3034|nr:MULTISPECIES: long-chain fatty acid--CoA ligase [Myxococcaceae]MBF5044835.1 AMP-binding protein [Simulacricoccus sp. 17bor-14]MRI90579.1 AMP-binding protein [Aggregicoccus sp. 17bor-14]